METNKIKQLFKLILPVSLLILTISCKGDKKDDSLSENDFEGTSSLSNSNTKVKSIKLYDAIIKDFIDCKSSAEEDRNLCRNEITKVISEIYSLSEFKNADQEYLIYDSIQPIISKSKKWENIGLATNPETLDEALAHTNNGGLSLIIDTSESYGHVVMVIAGKAKYSGSWEMNLPDVLSLLNFQADKSFYDKSLSYAFKKSDDLRVYIRH
jgi:hypothetical protein